YLSCLFEDTILCYCVPTIEILKEMEIPEILFHYFPIDLNAEENGNTGNLFNLKNGSLWTSDPLA
ncbi:MAG TPA: hypothetical protein VGN34_09040, partial [Ktedonobacteraceae bacterium]